MGSLITPPHGPDPPHRSAFFKIVFTHLRQGNEGGTYGGQYSCGEQGLCPLI